MTTLIGAADAARYLRIGRNDKTVSRIQAMGVQVAKQAGSRVFFRLDDIQRAALADAARKVEHARQKRKAAAKPKHAHKGEPVVDKDGALLAEMHAMLSVICKELGVKVLP